MLCAPEQEDNQLSLCIYTSLGPDGALDRSHSCVTVMRTCQQLVCRTLARISEMLLNSSHTPKKLQQNKGIFDNSIRAHGRRCYVFNLLLCNHLLSLLLFIFHLKIVKRLCEDGRIKYKNTWYVFIE